MLSYYSMITLISLISLFVLSVLIHENARLTRSDKRLFYLTYSLIAASALAEWIGVQLDGKENLPAWPLLAVKCADYILSPLAGGTLVRQMRLRNRWFKALNGVLMFNTAFQLVACPLGWTVTIDSGNHYAHGPLYGVYMTVYLVVIVITALEFILYGKTFQRENRQSLYATLLLIVVGIGIQEVLSGDFRTVYLTLTIVATLMFIHFSEFTQLATDDFVAYQRTQLLEDPLTGVQSRYAYKHALREYDGAASLPAQLAVFVIDINGLKEVNDTLGHDTGDELICGAARCVEKAFGVVGRCFRTGGDEFAVIAEMDGAEAQKKKDAVLREAGAWTGMHVKELNVSVGCGASRADRRGADEAGGSADVHGQGGVLPSVRPRQKIAGAVTLPRIPCHDSGKGGAIP